MALALMFGILGAFADPIQRGEPRVGVRLVGSSSPQCCGTRPRSIFAAIGGMFSERSGVVNIGLEGMLLIGAFFGHPRRRQAGYWVWGVVLAAIAGGRWR